ncbi:DksA/TraR family C4-type zinc finger protein [Marinobacter caseinilyticus]|uniref:DksA/TraR family C4-type zinc finger protein n=1 Tax=Marinobacter caseinilyticus TaxID=2692195 RepID=UPI00140756D0|nr:DksA/TraR family C4-type zinc finger protein [Marinobacter caseinilyticus]
MASGWAKEGAVQEQIDSTVEDALQRARGQLPTGESLSHCEECDAEIPEARRLALKGVRLCVGCQSKHDREQRSASGYNRRGSKDSQLR